VTEARGDGSFDVLLKTYRLRAGMTQRQLADLSTLSERAIRDLENGRARSPRQETVRLLADGLRLGNTQRTALEVATRRVVLGRAVLAENESLAPPATITALVGRESEHRTVTDLLGTGAQRWVAIVGLGGVGKTQLTMEVAATLHNRHGMSVVWNGLIRPGRRCCLVSMRRAKLRIVCILLPCVIGLLLVIGPGRPYPGMFTSSEINSLENLRRIPVAVNREVHLSRIRILWNGFYRTNAGATRRDVLDYATFVDDFFGDMFDPNIR
jgi:transcriptional regulator with XRE-family HTH domain